MNRSTSISSFLTKQCSIILLLLVCAGTAWAQPTITSISVTSAAPGSPISITGTGFSTTASANTVRFAGMKATVTAASATQLTVTVPKGATYGAITVMVSSLTAYSSQFFMPTNILPVKGDLTPVDLTHSGPVTMATTIYGMVSGDLDDDGLPDIALASSGAITSFSNVLQIIRNTSTTGNINFTSQNVLTIPGYDRQGIPGLGDLDGDGKLDIAIPENIDNAGHSSVVTSDLFVWRNGGSGSFTRSGPFSIDLNGALADIVDVDADGKPDVVVVSYQNRTASVLINTTNLTPGNISFSPTTNISLGGGSPVNLKMADLDGDGKPDIVKTNSTASGFNTLLNNSAGPGSVSFGSPATFSGSNTLNPGALYIGDVDGDGKLDVVLGFSSENSVAIYRNTSSGIGNISFDAAVYVQIGDNQQSVTLVDIDGDGKPDIVAGKDSKPLSVLRNTSSSGAISFDTQAGFNLTQPTNYVHALIGADFDNDGRNDLIAANNNNGRLHYYRNSPQYPPTVTSLSSSNVAPGSNVVITGTGFNSTAANNVVYFGPEKSTPTIASATSLTVAVPNGAQFGPLTVLNKNNLLSGMATKNFTPAFTPNKTTLAATDLTVQATFTGTGSLYGMAAADLTNDGFPELVVTDYGQDRITLYPNISTTGGTISYGSPTVLSVTGTLDDVRYPAIADLDGNGFLDLVVPSYTLSTVSVFLNTSSGSMTALSYTGSFTTGAGPIGIAIGDLDGDGRPEIVSANNLGSSVSVLRNIGTAVSTASFAAKQDFQVSAFDATYNVALADIDGDGKLDIIASRDVNASPGFAVVLINTSTIGNISFSAAQNFSAGKTPWTIVPADIDGDGLTDLVISSGSSSGNTVSVLRNTGSGGVVSFTKTDLSVFFDNIAITVADINGDGKPDIITGNRSPSASQYYTHLFPNTSTSGSISFGSRLNIAPVMGMSPASTVVTDMNKDGKPDIIMGNQINSSSSTVSIIRNTLITTPTTQASNINITSTGTTATLSWTNGNGAKRAVFVKQASSGTAAPVTGTDYTASTTFGSGTQIGSTGWYCAFVGTTNTVTMSGLSPSVSYTAMVTELNDGGLSNAAEYNTSSATNNPKTFITPATLSSITRAGALSTVNSSTVDYNVVFGSDISNLTTSNFTLAFSGSVAGASVTAVNGAGSSFSVTVNTGTGDGTIALRMVNAAGLTPTLTNTLPYTGEVYTIDKTAPTLSPVGIASNNSNTTLAFTGDIITLSFTSSETIATPAVTIAGGTATVTNTGGNNWTATYTITGAEAGGTIAFNISFSDIAGNAGTAVTATSNSSSVVHDKTAPTLSAVTITSNNANTALAKEADIVTLSFTSSEPIFTPVVTMAGAAATVTNTGGNNWKATYATNNTNPEGAIVFAISFKDLNNNAGTTVAATTNSSAVVFDKTNPSLSLATISTNNPNSNHTAKTGDIVTISITANESIIPLSSTIAGHTVTPTNSSGNTWTASYTMTNADTEGTITFGIDYTDLAGNFGSAAVAPSDGIPATFDKTNPALTSVTIASLSTPDAARAKANDFVLLSITGSEDLLAPTVIIAGHTLTATQNGSATAWSGSYRMTNTDPEGTIAFSISFSDASGNAGTTVTGTTNNSSVVFDRTAPSVSALTIASNNANPARAKVGDMITATMTVNEGIFTPTMTIAGRSTIPVYNGGNKWTATYVMTSADASQTVSIQASYQDLSGNNGIATSATTNNSSVIFDKTAPVLTAVTILSSGSNNTVVPGDQIILDFTASETITAPVVLIAGHQVTAVNTIGNSWQATYTMANADATGTVAFSIAFSDLSGNAGTMSTATTNSSSVFFSIPGSGPPFTGGTSQTMAVCQDAASVNINALMSVNAAAGTSLTWTVTKQPSGGTLSGFNTSIISGGGTVTPTGMAYTPLAKYYGADLFTIQVSDGTNTFTTTVNVTVNQLPALSVTGSAVLCEGLTTTLTAPASANASSFTWFRDGVQIGNVSGSTLIVSDIGTYTAYATSSTGCRSVISNSVTMLFYAKPKLSISAVDISCVNIPVTFTSTSSVSTVTSAITSWGDGNGSTPVSGTSPAFTYTQPGTYIVKYKVTPSTCSALADSITKPIVIEAVPKAAFSAAAASCINTPVQFASNSVVGAASVSSYEWFDGNGKTSSSTSPTFTYTIPGTYNVKLKVASSSCPASPDSIIKPIIIEAPVPGMRLATVDVAKNTLTPLQVRTLTGMKYNWVPSSFLTSPAIPNPQIFTSAQMDYKVMMVSAAGCITTDTLLVRVQGSSAIYVPNVFTPNGDGQNDKLIPNMVASIKSLRFFRIFNRWGKMLYETTQAGQGWDGRYNGELQPLDTYTWVIEGTDANGQLIKKQGSVTLLR